MVFFNYTTMQVTAKIVYYGPGLCGKTTNLQYIHHKTDPGSRGEMVSLETEADRTLFFDLLPLEVGVIGGMRVRLQLYTVPGQVFYNTTRKLVLKGVDGIVFVADSQIPALDANAESFSNLAENLEEINLSLEQIPFVFQYNKRDLKNIHVVETLNRSLNTKSYEVYEAAALHGVGVFETLKAISKKTLAAVHRKIDGEGSYRQPRVERPRMVAVPALPAREVARTVPASLPLKGSDEVRVEFAASLEVTPSSVRVEPATSVRKIATKTPIHVERELQKLRRMARDVSSPASSAQPIRRTVKLKLPSRVLSKLSQAVFDLHLLAGESVSDVPEVVKLDLAGQKSPVRLTLTFDLEGEEDS